jgi:hypothetical protein
VAHLTGLRRGGLRLDDAELFLDGTGLDLDTAGLDLDTAGLDFYAAAGDGGSSLGTRKLILACPFANAEALRRGCGVRWPTSRKMATALDLARRLCASAEEEDPPSSAP